MQLLTSEICALLSSTSPVPERTVRGYCIDSRQIRPGDLFFAIRGPHHDGHNFIRQAFEQGAASAVADEMYGAVAGAETAVIISVPDTTRALQQLARAVRRRWGGRVVGITGSTGKTTTKEMLAAILSEQFRVHKSAGNFNNQFGLPMALLGLEPRHEVAVMEMAMSHAGEIAHLASIAEPQIGVVTNVAPVHLEFFDSVDSIASAKRELIEHLQSPATAILNRDDERVRRFAEGFRGRVVTFGFDEGADLRVLKAQPKDVAGKGLPAMEFEIRGAAYRGSLSIPLPGRHNVENAMAAIAAASVFDISFRSLRIALGRFQSLGQRTEVLKLPQNVTVINDAYNSNPRAMERMLETLAGWPSKGRRIVLAGEMLELGPSSRDWHCRVGRLCAHARVDWLLAVQGDARQILEGAVKAGLPAERGQFFPRAEEAGRFCATIAQPGDVILVKGSRGVGLEKAISALEGALAAG